MNKYLFFSAAIAALTAVSCSKENPVLPCGEIVEMTVNVCMPEDVQTRAVEAYTETEAYETVVNKVQIFVFDGTGTLNAYQSGTSSSANLKVSAGDKQVYAIVNGPDLADVKTQSELEQKAVELSVNSKDEATGFVMSGSSSCIVEGTSSSCTITVSRLVSRIALVSVTNSLPASYGALVIERIWLSNVVGNQNLKGDAEPDIWLNKEGRADESQRDSTHIIDDSTYKASAEALTYKPVGQTIANQAPYKPEKADLFYAFPNSSDTAPDGFKEPFAPQRTVLVIAATVNGKLYYYPVVLKDGLVRNTTYTVGLTITGLGSDDPNKPVTKGGLDIDIKVEDWKKGSVYEEDI